jgi:hypothetical protein
MNIAKAIAIALFVAGFVVPAASHAQTLDAADRGWYRDNPTSGQVESYAPNLNYLVGRGVVSPGVRGEYRNFFAFDLGAFQGQTFTSATLSLYNPKFGDPFNNNATVNPSQWGGFGQGVPAGNANPYETFQLHQVLTDATTLLAGGAGRSGYDDLGDGDVFGSYNASLDDNGTFIKIVLNALGIAALNDAIGGMFVLGGSVSTIEATGGSQTVFGFSNDNNLAFTQLSLTQAVPEPGTYAMLLTGLVLMGAVTRRRNKKQF